MDFIYILKTWFSNRSSHIIQKCFLLMTLFIVSEALYAEVEVYRFGYKVGSYQKMSDLLGIDRFVLQKGDELFLTSDMDIDADFGTIVTNFVFKGNGHTLYFKVGATPLVFSGKGTGDANSTEFHFENVIFDGTDYDSQGEPIIKVVNNSSVEFDDKCIFKSFKNTHVLEVDHSLVIGGSFESNSIDEGAVSEVIYLKQATLSRTKIVNNSISAELETSSIVTLDNSTMVNCIVADNTSSNTSQGYAVRLLKDEIDAGTIINSTIVHNNCQYALYADEQCKVQNSIFYHSGDVVSNAELQSCITTDPKLNVDYTLKWGSPCIDAGNNLYYNERATDFGDKDFRGNDRFINETIDMGACEYRKNCGVDDHDAPALKRGAVLPQDVVDHPGLFKDCPAFPSVDDVKDLFEDDCHEVVVDSVVEIVSKDNCGWEVISTYHIHDELGNAADDVVVSYSGADAAGPTIVPAKDTLIGYVDGGLDVDALQLWVDKAKVTDPSGLLQLLHDFDVAKLPNSGVCDTVVQVKFTATDVCGKSSTATAKIHVIDTLKPLITVPVPFNMPYEDGVLEVSSIEGWLSMATVSDNNPMTASLKHDFDLSKLPANGQCGQVKVLFTAKDHCGNMSEDSSFINVKDVTAPIVDASLQKTIDAAVDQCSFSVPDVTAIVRAKSSDNGTAKADLIITQKPVAGSSITESTKVTIRVADLCGSSVEKEILVVVPAPLTMDVTSSEARCFGKDDGVIVGNISGGKAPYTIAWNNGTLSSEPVAAEEEWTISDLADGVYTVIVQDGNGCQATKSVVISELPQKITVKALDSTKVYDGEALSQNRYVVTGDLEPGDVLADVKISGSITDQGHVKNEVRSFAIMRGEQDVTCYYDTMMVNGTLTVTKRPLTISAVSLSKEYDGTVLRKDQVLIKTGELVAGDKMIAHAAGSQLYVGKSDNVVSSVVMMHGEKDVTDNYDIKSENGLLKVTLNRKAITIASRDTAWNYDGTLHKYEVYDVTYDGKTIVSADGKGFKLPTGDSLKIKGTAAGVTYVSDNVANNNTFTYELKNAGQYGTEVSETYGTIAISPKKDVVVITASDGEKMYDGKPLSNDGYSYTEGVLVSGDILKATVVGEQLHVGSSDNVVSSYKVMRGELDVTANYTFGECVKGTLKVTKRSVKLTSANDTKAYDGNPLTKEDVTVGGDGFVGEEGVEIEVTGSQTQVGKSYNTFDYSFKASTREENYEIDTTYGILEVTPNRKAITIASRDTAWVYDGTLHKYEVYDVTYDGQAIVSADGKGFKLPTGDSLKIKGTAAGVTYVSDNVANNNTFTYELKNADQYGTEVSETYGTIAISPKKDVVVITASDGEKMYDGKPLSNDGYSYTESVLVSGDILKATVVGEQLHVGSSDNVVSSYKVMRGELDVTANYTFGECVKGTLKVTKRSVKLTSANDTKAYDGKPLTKEDVTVGGDGFVGEEGVEIEVTGSQTQVGKSYNTFDYSFKANTRAENYEIDTTYGILEVTPNRKEITIASRDTAWVYDGTLHKYEVYDVTYDGQAIVSADGKGFKLPTGDSLKIKGTAAGVVNVSDNAEGNNTFSYELRNKDQYSGSITLKAGTLRINVRPVTLTSATDTKSYDGKPLTKEDVTIGGDGFVGEEGVEIEVTGSQTQVGKSYNTFDYSFKANTRAENYEIDTTYGILEVTPNRKEITIASRDTAWVYDGNLHKYEVYDVTYDGKTIVSADGKGFKLPTGDSLKIKGTAAGVVNVSDNAEGNNTFSYELRNKDQYSGSITLKAGTLRINVRPVTLKSATDTKSYDGKPLTNEDVTVGGDGFVGEEGVEIEVTGSQTQVGKSYNTFDYSFKASTREENYEIDTTYGSLEVTPNRKAITIASRDTAWIYDGNLHKYEVYDVTYDGKTIVSADGKGFKLPTGDSLKIKGTAAGVVNVSDNAEGNNTFRYELRNKDQYSGSITLKAGTLRINVRPVTLTSATDTKSYDGKPLAKEDVTVGGDGFVGEEGVEIEVTGSQTQVGKSYNTFDYSFKANTRAENYEIDTTYGSLEVTPNRKAITIASRDTAWVYDGNLHKYEVYDVTYDGKAVLSKDGKKFVLPTFDTITITGTAKGVTYVSDTKAENNTYTYVLSNRDQYEGDIKVSTGTLSIQVVPTPITITANSAKMVYDGMALTDGGFKYTKNVLASGDKLVVVVEGEIVDAGTVPNKVVSYKVVRGTTDVTKNYLFNDCQDGVLTVTKRQVVLRSATDKRVYNGEPLTNSTVEVVGDMTKNGFAYGEGATYKVTGSITEIGSEENTFTYKLWSNTKADNYDIKLEFGTLTILKVEEAITIKANSGSEMYSGKPFSDKGFSYTENILAKGDEIVAVVEGELTHVGSVANKVVSYKVMRGEADVTQNYTFTDSEDGRLTVTKRMVILTSATDSKVYDRTPLTNKKVEVSGDGFVKGEGASYAVTGTVTNFGESVENEFTYVLSDNTLEDDYIIKTVFGLLSISKRPSAIVFDYGYKIKSDTLGGFADVAYKAPADPTRKGYQFEAWKPELPTLMPLDTMKVVAQWNLLTYKVVLDTFEVLTYTVEDKKTIDLADYAPSRLGYNFAGWLDEKGNRVKQISTDDAKSWKLKATWEIGTYNINYVSAGELLKSVPVVYGKAIPQFEDPVRTGYIFKGWSPAVPATMPAGGVTVEAQWELVEYTLVLLDEGKNVGSITYTVEDGDFYIEGKEERPGQAFTGWLLDGEMLEFDAKSNRYLFHTADVARDALLEAVWVIVSNEFSITYKVDGVVIEEFLLMEGDETAPYAAYVERPKDKRGYLFDGWDIDLPAKMPRKNMVVNAVWKPIVYHISFKSEAGEEMLKLDYTFGDDVIFPSFEEREEKYVFMGWSDGTQLYHGFSHGTFSEDLEFTEVWEIKKFQMIYYVGEKEYARDTIAVGDTIQKIPDPEDYIEGYAFSGWSVTPVCMPSHDVKVTSYYERGGYTLHYMSEGEEMKSVRYLYEAPISPARGVSRYGYVFKYWKNVPATMPGKDVWVEAVYDVATYRMILRDGDVAKDTIYYTIYDDEIVLPVLSEKGRRFRGWYDGKKTITKVATGAYAANMELTANWLYFNYTLSFVVDDVIISKKNNMRCGDRIQLPDEPSKKGLYFVGWDGLPEDTLMPDNDLTLTALFSTEVGVEEEASHKVDVYTHHEEIHVLHAAGWDVMVMNLNGVVLFSGRSDDDDFVISMHDRGVCIVRVKDSCKKVILK